MEGKVDATDVHGDGPHGPSLKETARTHLLQIAIEQAAEAVMITDASGIILYVNPAFERLTGHPAAHVLGKTPRILKSGKQNDAFYQQFWQTISSGQIWHGQIVNRHEDGSIFAEQQKIVPVRDDGDRITHFVSIGQDITAQIRREKEVELFQTITRLVSTAKDVEEALIAVLHTVCEATGWEYGEAWLPLTDGTVLVCNSAWYGDSKRLGEFRRRSESTYLAPGQGLPGRVFATKQPEWHRDVSVLLETQFVRVDAARSAGLRAGFGVPVVVDNEVLAVLSFLMAEIRDEDHHLIQIVSTVATQLGTVLRWKQAEAALRASEAKYRALMDQASDPIILADLQGNLLEANQAAVTLFGRAQEELRNVQLWDLYPSEELARVDTVFQESLHSGSGALSDTSIRRPDGTLVPVDVTASVIDYAGTRVFQAIFRDMSERKKREARLAYLANHDPLTGLPNRKALMEALNKAVERAREGVPSVLLVLDLDGFKNVNDTFGHTAGDNVLVMIAGLLRRSLRPSDLLTRFGGDEFIALLEEVTVDEGQAVAERLRVAVEAFRSSMSALAAQLGVSIGVVAIDGTESAITVIARADAAMYTAKRRGGNNTFCYQPHQDSGVTVM